MLAWSALTAARIGATFAMTALSLASGCDPTPEPEISTTRMIPVTSRPARANTPEPVREAAASTPVEHRMALRAMMVSSAPRYGASFRGKIPRREVFAVLEHVEGPADDDSCGEAGWGRLHHAAYVCLDHTELTEATGRVMPGLAPGQLTPFFYARLRPKDLSGDNPPAPVWRSRFALRRGVPAIDALEPEHDYAFVERRRRRGGAVLIDSTGRAVQERDVERLQPSAFEGRDLSEDPLPADKILAWSVHWPAATLRDEPRPDAQDVGPLEYHVRLYVVGDPVDQPGTTFYRVDGDEERWVDGREIRRYLPFESPREVDANTSWVDVDLDQQVLTLMRGTTPIFVTLISSGGYKDPTPVGLFRISTKVAYDDMRSREGDDEPYHVEAVPWVQYFNGRYALHGTFWHNRFGLRTSHGCINLSAKDAARVFAATLPEPPAGWISVYEHPEDLGTLLRIRNGPREPPDRRRPPATRGTLGDEP